MLAVVERETLAFALAGKLDGGMVLDSRHEGRRLSTFDDHMRFEFVEACAESVIGRDGWDDE